MTRTALKLASLCALAGVVGFSTASYGAADYETARKNFSSKLAFAQTRGVGIAAYEMFAREIDKEAQTEGSDKSIERLSALEKKLQEQITETDREGFDSIGSEISTKLQRSLKRNISFYSGTSIEFTVGKDSSVGTIRWFKKSQSSLFDRELATALSQLSLNRRSPNQAELPITIRLTLSANGCDLVACEPANGKSRYLIFLKSRCCPPAQTKSAKVENNDVLGWDLE